MKELFVIIDYNKKNVRNIYVRTNNIQYELMDGSKYIN